MKALWVQGDAIRTQELADAVLARVERGGFTDVFQYTACSTAMYRNSAYLPFAYSGDFDPARYVISRYHDIGVAVHAWLCPGWCMQSGDFRAAHQGWTCVENGAPEMLSFIPANWLCFDVPEAREFWVNVAAECQAIGFDGVHWDYIRYSNGWNPETQTMEYYPPSYFTKDGVTRLVSAARYALNVQNTAAVMSALRSACPDMLQWWDEWLLGDLIDAAIPMLYHYAGDEMGMASRMEQWAGLPTWRITPGLRLETDWNADTRLKTVDELAMQVQLCERFTDVSFFDENALTMSGGDALLDYIAGLGGGDMALIDEIRALGEQAQVIQLRAQELSDLCRAFVDAEAQVEVHAVEIDDQLDALKDVIEVD